MNHQNPPVKSGKVVLFQGHGKHLTMHQFPVRPLKKGEILVKNLYTTICGSDLHTFCGLREEPLPTVLGHEMVGEIIEIESGHTGTDIRGRGLAVGDRITWAIFASDPDSPNALAGIPQKGGNVFKYGHAVAAGSDIFHGGLSEYCILKVNTGILKLPEGLPLPVASTLNCSISTVAGALRLAGQINNKNILITGMGHLGITCAAMCRDAGAAWIIAADIKDKRLAEALHFGADDILHLQGDDHQRMESMRRKLQGKSIDVVFDMSGSTDAMELGLQHLAIGGTAVWIGAVFKTRPLRIMPEAIIRNLLTIRGLHNYNYADFEYALDFIERNWNKYPFEQAVEKEFPLHQAEEAFGYAISNRPFRVGVRMQP